ncbi:DUF4389 domain-containing protein [Patulibacter sp.]|uniref:DUF4389 domain-containing protein n=1 Tax=Patulibacter sp. TaxID=1912859 RepID=UPI00271BFCAC|nr:DUF4389 domain-containing protein [Patulibacter sp.]MDO9409989.1 DUF4389 domain-containing protein [Patulibacter sp.]
MPAPGELLFIAPNAERHSRLTAFFRWILVIPHAIVWFFYGIVTYVAVIIAWFALLFTGRYPAGLYSFVRGFVRFHTRFYSYLYLLSDRFPPFSGSDETTYPIELEIGPAKESYSRLWVLLRFLPLILVGIINYALSIVLSVVAFIAWVAIIILGRNPDGLHNAIAFCVSYSVRSTAYSTLLVERFPSFDTSGAGPAVPPTTPAAATY